MWGAHDPFTNPTNFLIFLGLCLPAPSECFDRQLELSGEKLQGGGYPLTRDAIGNIISRLRKRSGVARLPPRRLRHTFAVNFLDDDHGEGDPDALRRIMGHERFEVTRQYLVGRQKRSVKDAFDRRSHVDNLGLEERRFRKRPRQEPPE